MNSSFFSSNLMASAFSHESTTSAIYPTRTQ